MTRQKTCPQCGFHFDWCGIWIDSKEYCMTECFNAAWNERSKVRLVNINNAKEGS
jgi:hypothetical protein